MRSFTLQGLMWMEERIGWLKEIREEWLENGGFPN